MARLDAGSSPEDQPAPAGEILPRPGQSVPPQSQLEGKRKKPQHSGGAFPRRYAPLPLRDMMSTLSSSFPVLDDSAVHLYSVTNYSGVDIAMSLLHVNLTPTAYAILGLLHEQSMHGYEIAQHFKLDIDLGQVVPADISTVYSFLKDLQEHGLLSGKRETVGAQPPRTVFSLTAGAAELFLAWVYRPVARIREVRLDFLLKLYFARRLSATKTHALIEAQLTICRDYLTRQQTQIEALDAKSFDSPYYSPEDLFIRRCVSAISPSSKELA